MRIDEDGNRWYTVERGDTMWGISDELLGDGRLYPEVFDLNREQARVDDVHVLRDPNLIWPDLEIELPHDDRLPAVAISAPASRPQRHPSPSRRRRHLSHPKPSCRRQRRPARRRRRIRQPARSRRRSSPSSRTVPPPPPHARAGAHVRTRPAGARRPELQALRRWRRPPRAAWPRPSSWPAPSWSAAGGLRLTCAEPESDVSRSRAATPSWTRPRWPRSGCLAMAAAIWLPWWRAVWRRPMYTTSTSIAWPTRTGTPSAEVRLLATRHGRSSTTLVLAAPLAARPLLLRPLPAVAELAFGERVDVEGLVSHEGDVLIRLTGVARQAAHLRAAAAADGERPEVWPRPRLVPLGVLNDHQVLAANWDALGHLLVAAPLGQGAATALVALLAPLLARATPDELGLEVIAGAGQPAGRVAGCAAPVRASGRSAPPRGGAGGPGPGACRTGASPRRWTRR